MSAPTIGRIVIYVDLMGQNWPAIVLPRDIPGTGPISHPEGVNLHVFDLTDSGRNMWAVTEDPDGGPYSWHWPVRDGS